MSACVSTRTRASTHARIPPQHPTHEWPCAVAMQMVMMTIDARSRLPQRTTMGIERGRGAARGVTRRDVTGSLGLPTEPDSGGAVGCLAGCRC